jgi:O-antigen/teichoic acid export membrane protein
MTRDHHPVEKADTRPPEVRARALLASTMQRAMLWNLLGVVFSQGFGFLVFLVLATKLPPEVVGVVALASMATDFVAVDGRSACMDAIVQARRDDVRHLNSAFAAFFSVALIVSLGTISASSVVAETFNEPLIAGFMNVFALLILPIPWVAVMDALLMKDLQFRQFTQRNIVASLIAGICGIAWTFSPWVIWALVVQRLVGLVAEAVLEFHMTRWFPTRSIDWKDAVQFLKRLFALWTILIVTQIIGRAFTFVFGLRYDAATVGLMRAASRIVEAVQIPVVSSLMGLWFPLMSKVRGNLKAERDIYNNIIRTAVFLCFPAFAGVALVAGDVVRLLFSDRYQDAGPMIEAIATSRLLVPIVWFNTIAMTSLGMNRLSLVYSMAALIVELPSLIVFTHLSAPEALLLVPAPTIVGGIIGNAVLNRRLGQSNWSHYRELMPAIFATLGMVACTWTFRTLAVNSPTLWRLCGSVLIGAVVYLGWLAVFNRGWLLERIRLLRGRGQDADTVETA